MESCISKGRLMGVLNLELLMAQSILNFEGKSTWKKGRDLEHQKLSLALSLWSKKKWGLMIVTMKGKCPNEVVVALHTFHLLYRNLSHYYAFFTCTTGSSCKKPKPNINVVITKLLWRLRHLHGWHFWMKRENANLCKNTIDNEKLGSFTYMTRMIYQILHSIN